MTLYLAMLMCCSTDKLIIAFREALRQQVKECIAETSKAHSKNADVTRKVRDWSALNDDEEDEDLEMKV